MVEPTGPASSQPQPEEMHWAISYLRIEIRNDLRGLHERLDGTNSRNF